jgi:hypothetical protein
MKIHPTYIMTNDAACSLKSTTWSRGTGKFVAVVGAIAG